MGTLYWQLNDTWPVVSWSSRDYFGRWKALHFAAKEAFEPVLISPVIKGDTVEIWGISDLPEPLTGSLHFELMDFDGATHFQATVPAAFAANRSRLLWQTATSQLLGDADPRRVVLSADFRVDSGQSQSAPRNQAEPGEGQIRTPSALLYFRSPGELALDASTIRFDVTGAEGGVLLTLESDVLAKSVYLNLKDEGGDGRSEARLPGTLPRFGNNFFDLLPNRPRVIFLETGLLPEVVADLLTIRTLAEIPREGTPVMEESGG
jgi:beta-mannosidase